MLTAMEGYRGFLGLLVSALLVGFLSVIFVLVWVLHYREGLGWDGGALEFNWHPVLAVTGFVFIQGIGTGALEGGGGVTARWGPRRHRGLREIYETEQGLRSQGLGTGALVLWCFGALARPVLEREVSEVERKAGSSDARAASLVGARGVLSSTFSPCPLLPSTGRLQHSPLLPGFAPLVDVAKVPWRSFLWARGPESGWEMRTGRVFEGWLAALGPVCCWLQ